MKKYLVLILLAALVSCNSNSKRSYNKVKITQSDSVKNISVEIHTIGTIYLQVGSNISDSLILESIKHVTDSLRADSVRRGKIQKDNFLKMTKRINGGYNGLNDRLDIWERAKKELNKESNEK